MVRSKLYNSNITLGSNSGMWLLEVEQQCLVGCLCM